MIVPLGYFLIAWLVLLAIYGILVFLTLVQTLRHGLAAPLTYVTSFLFLAVIVSVVAGCGTYFLDADWKAGVNVIPAEVGSVLMPGAEQRVIGDIPLE